MEETIFHPTQPVANAAQADSWIDIVDPKERRRRQNRLNQRAHKLRKGRLAQRQIIGESSLPSCPSNTSFGVLVPTSEATAPLPEFYCAFPLGVDHLLSLIHLNVYRAIIANSLSMSLSHIFSTCQQPNDYVTSLHFPSQIPTSLLPTRLQLTIPHEPSIDFFPLPRLRDNVISAGDDIFATGDFCRDMLGTLFLNNRLENSDRNGLIVWGEPWDINAWECTPGFLRKWGWLLAGCEELLNATNRWRAFRGEKPIFNH